MKTKKQAREELEKALEVTFEDYQALFNGFKEQNHLHRIICHIYDHQIFQLKLIALSTFALGLSLGVFLMALGGA